MADIQNWEQWEREERIRYYKEHGVAAHLTGDELRQLVEDCEAHVLAEKARLMRRQKGERDRWTSLEDTVARSEYGA